jgi:hypothetical protein
MAQPAFLAQPQSPSGAQANGTGRALPIDLAGPFNRHYTEFSLKRTVNFGNASATRLRDQAIKIDAWEWKSVPFFGAVIVLFF